MSGPIYLLTLDCKEYLSLLRYGAISSPKPINYFQSADLKALALELVFNKEIIKFFKNNTSSKHQTRRVCPLD